MAIRIPTTSRQVFGGTKTLKSRNHSGFTFGAYQSLDRALHYYFNDSSSYPVSAVGTANLSSQFNNTPPKASLFEKIRKIDDAEVNRPLVVSDTSYTRVNATAQDDGIEIDIGDVDLSKYNAVALVTKSPSSSISGKIHIQTDSTNESVCSFTTPSIADKWAGGAGNDALYFSFQDFSDPNVSEVGTFDATSVKKLQVTLDSTDSLDPYELYFVESIQQNIGYDIDITENAVSSVENEFSREFENVLRNQVANSTISTESNFSVQFTFKEQDLKIEALGMGDVLSFKNADYIKKAQKELTVVDNAGQKEISYNSNLTINSIFDDSGKQLDKVYKSSQVPTGAYFDDGNGKIVLSNQVAAGAKFTANIAENADVKAYDFFALEQSPVGFMTIPITSESGVTKMYIGNKVQMSLTGMTPIADDGGTITLTFTFFADKEGKHYRVAEL